MSEEHELSQSLGVGFGKEMKNSLMLIVYPDADDKSRTYPAQTSSQDISLPIFQILQSVLD